MYEFTICYSWCSQRLVHWPTPNLQRRQVSVFCLSVPACWGPPTYFNDRKQQLQNISAFVHAVLDDLAGRKINFLKQFPVVTGTLTLHDLVDALQDCVRQCTAKALTEQQVCSYALLLTSQLIAFARLVFGTVGRRGLPQKAMPRDHHASIQQVPAFGWMRVVTHAWRRHVSETIIGITSQDGRAAVSPRPALVGVVRCALVWFWLVTEGPCVLVSVTLPRCWNNCYRAAHCGHLEIIKVARASAAADVEHIFRRRQLTRTDSRANQGGPRHIFVSLGKN